MKKVTKSEVKKNVNTFYYEILAVTKRKNYSVTFVNNDKMEENLSELYEGFARILHKQYLE